MDVKAGVQELVDLVFIVTPETVQSLSVVCTYQSLKFILSFSLFILFISFSYA